MRRLDLTRDRFAERIATKRKTLDSWLLPRKGGKADRGMPDMAWKFISEILEKEAKND